MPQENTHSDAETTEPRSVIACHVCRKRKIKCGRELPNCSLCKQSMQTCGYPEKPLRPGPKIGSTQEPRKRKARDGLREEQPPETRRRNSSSAQRGRPQPSEKGRPGSTEGLSPPESPTRNAKDMQSLSFIIHPSHESCSPKKSKDDTPSSLGQGPHENHVVASCYSLGLDPNHLSKFIDKFFGNFTSFQLFRESDFLAVLQCVTSTTQCKALLAAMLAFACKSCDEYQSPDMSSGCRDGATSSYFSVRALKYVDLAISECEDEPLPLPLLQALVLITHWLLVQGVRGRAWRYLGIAIRSAYEMNLHLIDAGKGAAEMADIDPIQWCEDEERRRAWWAIWEMDVFASVIRRCPTGIDWSQNETFLPAEDDRWIRGEPQKSCTLKLDVVERSKALQATGNQSAKAWFIVINSLMKDAQKITSPVSVDETKAAADQSEDAPQSKEASRDPQRTTASSKSKEPGTRLRTIENALQCTVMALPTTIKYRNQYLSFGVRDMDRHTSSSRRLLHSSIYSIHVMAQLTKLMIFKYSIFRSGLGSSPPPEKAKGGSSYSGANTSQPSAGINALQQYSEAADEIVLLVGRSYEEHYKYVNPFLANTIWLAGAVQLLYRELGSLSSAEKELTNSNLELLSMTYNRFVSYWNMASTLQKNLEVVESELEKIKAEAQKSQSSRRDMYQTHRSSAAKRRPSKRDNDSPTQRTANGGPGTGERRNDDASNRISDSVSRPPMDTTTVPNATWSAMNNNNNFYGSPVQLDPMDPRLFSDDLKHQTQQQQGQIMSTSNVRASSNVGNFIDSTTAMQQMAAIGQSSTKNGLAQQDHFPLLFNGTDDPSGLSPDFLNGMSFSRDSALANLQISNFLGEMLSGSYTG